MKHLTITLAGVLLLGLAAPALADPCDAVKREMAFGQAATEDAKDETGFKRAAAEFKKAADKAPDCAAAFFNLGIVQEQAGELAAAKAAYEQYLKLASKAADAAKVEQQIFKLEYRLQQAVEAASTTAPSSPQSKLEGVWCEVNACGDNTRTPHIFDVTIKDGQFRMIQQPVYAYAGNDCKIGMSAIYEGSITADGTIRGTYRSGDKRFEQRCVAGNLPVNTWNYTDTPMTGRVLPPGTQGLQGSMIQIKYDQWVQGNRYPTTYQFRRR